MNSKKLFLENQYYRTIIDIVKNCANNTDNTNNINFVKNVETRLDIDDDIKFKNKQFIERISSLTKIKR